MYSRIFLNVYFMRKGIDISRQLVNISRSSSFSSLSHIQYSNKKIFCSSQTTLSSLLNSKSFFTTHVSASLTSQSSKPPSTTTSSHEDDSFLPTDSDDDGEDNNAQDADDIRVEDVKEKIFAAALTYVPQYGWTKEALAKGAKKAGFSPMTHGLMQHSAYELVSYHYKEANRQLVQYMKEGSPTKTSIRVFIEDAIKHRLSLNVPYMDVWPQAMILMTQPSNLTDSLFNMASLVDDIWFHAGDTSVDFNWYSKRLMVSGVYKSTELYMIGDSSTGNHGEGVDGYLATWEFLSRRMDNIDLLGDFVCMASKAPEMMTSLFEVARNVLSMNDLNRKY